MNLAHIDTIIFDFGGVLINLDYSLTIEQFKELGIKNFDELYSQVNQSNLFDDLETGKISQQRFINGILDYLPPGTSPNKVVSAWNAMILDVPKVSIDLLSQLRSSYRLFMLSNTNEIHITKAYSEWAKTSSLMPDSLFEKVYLSHTLGKRKPHPETFQFVCDEQNLDPSKTLFIDDSLQHIEGAKQIGLNTFHLTSQELLSTLFS